ncbi:MAG: metallophosphoesterase family protein [Methanopyri archaeon]|nr:metallophosphoesterase family protein [Methanopyri archaeon]
MGSDMGGYDTVRILCCSDLHGRDDLAREAAADERVDLVFVLGDAEGYWDSDVPVYAVPGNHEDWQQVDDILTGRRTFRGLTLIPSGTVARIPELDATAGALGGVWAERPRKRGHFRKVEVSRLKEAGHVDVLLTHESPRPLWHGCSTITHLVASLSPSISLSGHVHSPQIMRYEATDTWLVNTPPITEGHAVVTWVEGLVKKVELKVR